MAPRVAFFGRQAGKSTGQAETAPARIPKKERSKERMPQAFLILRIFEAHGRHLMVPELQQRSVRAFFSFGARKQGKCLGILGNSCILQTPLAEACWTSWSREIMPFYKVGKCVLETFELLMFVHPQECSFGAFRFFKSMKNLS